MSDHAYSDEDEDCAGALLEEERAPTGEVRFDHLLLDFYEVYSADVAQGSDEWLELRKKYLTASEFAHWIGQHPYPKKRGRYSVVEEKFTDPKHSASTLRNFAHGHFYESIAADVLEAVLLKPLERRGFYFCPELCLGASPDRVVVEPDGSIANYEIKCPIGGVIPAEVPVQYALQVDVQNLLLGASKSFVYFWTPWKKTKLLEVPVRDPEEFICTYKTDIEDFKFEINSRKV